MLMFILFPDVRRELASFVWGKNPELSRVRRRPCCATNYSPEQVDVLSHANINTYYKQLKTQQFIYFERLYRTKTMHMYFRFHLCHEVPLNAALETIPVFFLFAHLQHDSRA